MEILPITWYADSPIDFEHKQYTLFAYLHMVENSFLSKVLSPHLLHMEKMVIELRNFEDSYCNLRKDFDRHRYFFDDVNPKLIGEDFELVYEVMEIVKFSIPQVNNRIEFGYKILEKNKQVLY